MIKRAVCAALTGSCLAQPIGASEPSLYTHSTVEETVNIEKIVARLQATPASDLALPFPETLDLLHQMTQFELGRFLLKNGGINGFWTAYWLIHGPKLKLDHPLENWLINKAPAFMASRERANIFAAANQGCVTDNVRFATVPSGLMDDLLRLNYQDVKGVELWGFDLDEDSIAKAQENAIKLKPDATVHIQKADAFKLPLPDGTLDLLTSNGLNFYIASDEKVVDLYREFTRVLKPGGRLVTSFITPPPSPSNPSSTWKVHQPQDLVTQQAIFVNLMQAKWFAVRTEEKTRTQLEEAGFKVDQMIYDSQGIFPTVIATKL